MVEIGDIVERTGAKSKYRFGVVTGFCPDGWQMHVKVTDLQSRTWQPEETRVVGPFVDESKSPALKCRCCGTRAEVILKWREWLREPETVLCWSCRYDHFRDGGDAFEEVKIAYADAGT